MNYTESVERMRLLKLNGMASAFEGILEAKQAQHLSTEPLLALLLQHEYDERHNRKIVLPNKLTSDIWLSWSK